MCRHGARNPIRSTQAPPVGDVAHLTRQPASSQRSDSMRRESASSPENLIQGAVILDDLRDTHFETIKHIAGFRPADNLFIRCVTAKGGKLFVLAFSFLKPILAIAIQWPQIAAPLGNQRGGTHQVRIKQMRTARLDPGFWQLCKTAS
jgi:hypothetical protein